MNHSVRSAAACGAAIIAAALSVIVWLVTFARAAFVAEPLWLLLSGAVLVGVAALVRKLRRDRAEVAALDRALHRTAA